MPLDEADKKFIGDLIKESLKPETIGAAVKSHLEGLKLDEKIAEKVKDATKDLKAPKKGEEDDEDEVDDKGKKKPKSGESAADKKLAAIEKRLADETKAREEAEGARKRDQLEAAAKDALVKAGVPAERVRHAMAVLKQDGVLDFTAEGKPGWKGKDKYQVDTVLGVDDGAAAWVKSDDGKAFLPASNAGGIDQPGGKRPPITNPKGEIDMGALGQRISRAVASTAAEH